MNFGENEGACRGCQALADEAECMWRRDKDQVLELSLACGSINDLRNFLQKLGFFLSMEIGGLVCASAAVPV